MDLHFFKHRLGGVVINLDWVYIDDEDLWIAEIGLGLSIFMYDRPVSSGLEMRSVLVCTDEIQGKSNIANFNFVKNAFTISKLDAQFHSWMLGPFKTALTSHILDHL